MGWGAGSVAGALGARRLPARFEGWAVTAGSISVVVCYGLISVTPLFASVVVLMAVVSLCDGFNTVAGQGILQRGSPDRVRGRVMSAVSTVGLLANSVAFPLAGVMVDRLGPRQVYAVGSIVAAASLPFAARLLKRIDALRPA
jgi:MFS family permease